MKNYRQETICVQGGYTPGNGEPRQIPIVQSTTFRYATSEDMGKLFDLEASGYFYSRLQNPTCDYVAAKITQLEGGTAGMLTSSGQAANFFALFNLANCGDHIVSSSTIYGGTFNLMDVTMRKMGVEVTFLPPDCSAEELNAAFRSNTKVVFGETIANPALTVLDIEKWAKAAHDHGVPLIIDNTFATPVNCRPFEWGADIVTHSTTKYMDGHGVPKDETVAYNLIRKAEKSDIAQMAEIYEELHLTHCGIRSDFYKAPPADFYLNALEEQFGNGEPYFFSVILCAVVVIKLSGNILRVLTKIGHHYFVILKIDPHRVVDDEDDLVIGQRAAFSISAHLQRFFDLLIGEKIEYLFAVNTRRLLAVCSEFLLHFRLSRGGLLNDARYAHFIVVIPLSFLRRFADKVHTAAKGKRRREYERSGNYYNFRVFHLLHSPFCALIVHPQFHQLIFKL